VQLKNTHLYEQIDSGHIDKPSSAAHVGQSYPTNRFFQTQGIRVIGKMGEKSPNSKGFQNLSPSNRLRFLRKIWSKNDDLGLIGKVYCIPFLLESMYTVYIFNFRLIGKVQNKTFSIRR